MKRSLVRCAATGATLLAACAPQPAPRTAPVPASLPVPAAPAAPPAPTREQVADSVGRRVTALADEYMAALMERSPELATQLGVDGARNDRLADNSPAAVRAWEAREDAWLAGIGAVDPASLEGRNEMITYAVLRETLESSRQMRVCRNELWPVSQINGLQTTLPFLAQIQPVGSAEARAQTLARWHAVPRYVDTEIANLREGARTGYTAPKVNVRRVVAQLDGLVSGPAAKSPFMSPADRDSAAGPEFRRELQAVVAAEVVPAIRRYRDFLRDEYLPAARENIAVSANPGGAECYRAAVRNYATVSPTPQEVHQMGLRQMERIQAEMTEIARRSFGTGDVPALLQRFRTDPKYMFRSRQEMVAYARGALDRAKQKIPQYFGILPRADVIIDPYPEFQEASAPGGEYFSPAEDGSRPGIYRINTYEANKQSRVGLESTAFHETIPGHHLQGAIALERKDLHPIARFLYNSGYVEGWGLYAERLADEMGLFSSDLDRMGLLSNEALRAARLVVDPGMHALGWTRRQAIDYMLAHTADSRQSIEAEVDRYINWPGQATSYMIGNLEIRRLREQARQELGAKFDIREFHDRVLENGSVPLPLLRHNIERWIAAKKQAG
ncbi:MAG: DUF885 domain-containing protein [Gemmatimonadetes bacterium]|nr:DUF885 domain-containing protein [Gemmatimonadota bacterium]